ncbi:DUF4097 family beta strand repeat-containing protein [Cohnella phaseoli]|uniref:Putative adhesin n=1 Tax=Cohnella phaseoli TaxID=456490 RepID=A0A3D9KHE6_9BACL|nr:DUF4097 family beta strand repeat-containing protein [Cohnella phaseoli]RED85582.1 putative adhesin [Cohnella phaseoli]
MRKKRNSAKLFAILVMATALTACGDLASSVTGEVQQSVMGDNSGSGKLVSVEKRSYTQDEFEELEVSAQAMEIRIERSTGERAEVELLVDDTLRDRFEFEAKVDSGLLKVTVEEKSKNSFKDQTGARKLRISLPDKMYQKLKVNNAFGSVEASDVQTKAADIRIDAGNIRVKAVTGKLELEANAGEIVVEGIALADDLKARTDVGRIAIHLSESPQDAGFKLESEVGEVKVELDQVEYSKQAANKKVGTIGTPNVQIDAYAAVGEIVVNTQR